MQRPFLVLCCALAAGSSTSYAAGSDSSSTPSDANAAGAAEPLAEIIVTAQKREQNINDVGITITATTAEQLKAAGVESVYDLPKVTPGLTVGQTFAGYPVFSLRGVNFNSAQLAAPPAVSTYIDEAALPYPPMTSNMLFDVEHVEVLKGPQGTLFGQNATGGSINVIAAKPTRELSSGVGTEVNNFGQTRFDGFISGPLSDLLRARVAALEPVVALFGWSAVSVSQDGDGARVTARQDPGGEPCEIEGAYVVGCDGARSLVREQAGIPNGGADFNQRMVLAVFRSRDLDAGLERFPPRTTYRVLHPELEGYWRFFGRVDAAETWF